MPEEIMDKEAVEAYKEVAEERGEEFRLPPGYKLPKDEEEQPKEEEKPEEEREEELEEEQEEEQEETEDEEESEEEAETEEEEEEENSEEKGEEEKEEVLSEEDVTNEIRQIAIDEGLKMSEAKEKYEARTNLVKKYKGDPKQMAKALQNTQSAYDKLKKQVESTPKYEEGAFQMQQELAKVPQFVQKNRDQIIQNIREKNPRKTSNMDDDDILAEAEKYYGQQIQAKYEKQLEEMKEKAVDIKRSALQEIAQEDREFIPEVREMLDNLSENQIVSAAFNIQDFVQYARGKKYTPEVIKNIREEAFKKGQEEAKIIGEKRPIKQPATKKVTKPAGTAKAKLTQRQRNRAVEMFPDEPEEAALAMYKDTFKDELKKNPQFVAT